MKTRPIILSAESVRAILGGRKTQTRRVMKRQPQPNGGNGFHPVYPYRCPDSRWNWCLEETGMGTGNPFGCPYGQPGDRLWVRETWATIAQYNDLKPSKIPKGDDSWPTTYYAAYPQSAAWNSPNRGKARPSIHMPRWASRITLEVTGVRVERVQDIGHQDATAEGWPSHLDLFPTMNPESKSLAWFRCLWDSINSKRGFGFSENPWVWVVEFKVLKGPRKCQ